MHKKPNSQFPIDPQALTKILLDQVTETENI